MGIFSRQFLTSSRHKGALITPRHWRFKLISTLKVVAIFFHSCTTISPQLSTYNLTGKLMAKLFIQRAVKCKNLLINLQFFTSFARVLHCYTGHINVLLIFSKFISKPFRSLRLYGESFCTIQQQIMIIEQTQKQFLLVTNEACSTNWQHLPIVTEQS